MKKKCKLESTKMWLKVKYLSFGLKVNLNIYLSQFNMMQHLSTKVNGFKMLPKRGYRLNEYI